MKFSTKTIAATAALAVSTLALPAGAQVYASTDRTSFDTLRKGIATYDFPFTATATSLGASYRSSKVTFASAGSNGLVGYNDCAFGANDPYLADFSNKLTVSYNGPVLGIILGSYSGTQTVDYVVNGMAGSIKVLGGGVQTFLGLDNGGNSSSISISFTHCSELDILGFQTAVPEAATWAMMMIGFGAIGGSLRRRRGRTSTRVSFA